MCIFHYYKTYKVYCKCCFCIDFLLRFENIKIQKLTIHKQKAHKYNTILFISKFAFCAANKTNLKQLFGQNSDGFIEF